MSREKVDKAIDEVLNGEENSHEKQSNSDTLNEAFKSFREAISKFEKVLDEVEKNWSKDVDVETGKMHKVLAIPQDEKIEDHYDSGEELADDLVDAVGDEKEASSMIAYAANINPENDIYDKALKAIGRKEYEN